MNSQIWFGIKVLSVLALIASVFAQYTYYKAEKRDTTIIERGILRDYELVSWDKDKFGYWIDVRDTKTQNLVIGGFVSLKCPKFENRANVGMVMKLVENKRMVLKTQETFIELDRSYDYLCTNKDMKREDEILLNKIEEAKKEAFRNLNNLN